VVDPPLPPELDDDVVVGEPPEPPELELEPMFVVVAGGV
jgi:hypothetical protein